MADMEKVSLYIYVFFIMTNFEVAKRFKTSDLFLVEINQQEKYPKVHKKNLLLGIFNTLVLKQTLSQFNLVLIYLFSLSLGEHPPGTDVLG